MDRNTVIGQVCKGMMNIGTLQIGQVDVTGLGKLASLNPMLTLSW
jgi:hypothetical protein